MRDRIIGLSRAKTTVLTLHCRSLSIKWTLHIDVPDPPPAHPGTNSEPDASDVPPHRRRNAMYEHGLVTLAVLTLAAVMVLAFWRKILLLAFSVAIAIFVLGLFSTIEMFH